VYIGRIKGSGEGLESYKSGWSISWIMAVERDYVKIGEVLSKARKSKEERIYQKL